MCWEGLVTVVGVNTALSCCCCFCSVYVSAIVVIIVFLVAAEDFGQSGCFERPTSRQLCHAADQMMRGPSLLIINSPSIFSFELPPKQVVNTISDTAILQ